LRLGEARQEARRENTLPFVFTLAEAPWSK
jgi:hypothetical protein